jgi:hypothetical protein
MSLSDNRRQWSRRSDALNRPARDAAPDRSEGSLPHLDHCIGDDEACHLHFAALAAKRSRYN